MYYDDQFDLEFNDSYTVNDGNFTKDSLEQQEIFDLEIGDSLQSQINMKDIILDYFLYIRDYRNSTGLSIGNHLTYTNLISYYKESYNICH